MRKVIIIEAPSNLGLIEPAPGRQPGVNKLPQWLEVHGFYERLSPQRIVRLAPPKYGMSVDRVSGVRNASAIIKYSAQLAEAVKKAVSLDHFPIVIGGDCSILLGCTLGLKRVGTYGLFFIDGHTDFVLPADSITKAVAGMDLALVTGYGPEQLTDIEGQAPFVAKEHVMAFGNRYYQPGYVKAIEDAVIPYYDLRAIRETGVQAITTQFLTQINQLAGFWIHLDVDVLNDELMPCVDSRQAGGLSYPELSSTLRSLFASGLVRGMNITILDPDLDKDGRYAKRFIDELASILTVGSLGKTLRSS